MTHNIGGKGFHDLPEADIVKLDEEDLVWFINDTNTNDNEPAALTAKIIYEGLALGRKFGNYFLQNDLNVEWALRFQQDINQCVVQYEEKYKI